MRVSVIIALIAFVFASCSMNTGTGILSGTVIGCGAGSVIDGGRGALIGSAVGALIGGFVGAALDEQDRRIMERSCPRTVERMDRSEPLTINDIIKLSQGGVPDDTIIEYIINSDSHYSLSQAQIKRMQEAGVSQRVINVMRNN